MLEQERLSRAAEKTPPQENKRHTNKHVAAAAVRAACIMLCAAVMLALCGCSEKGNDWITAPTSQQEEQTGAQNGTAGLEGETFEGELPAPGFVSGSYLLTSETVNTQNYSDANGTDVYSYSMLTRYVYLLDIAVGDSITCRYTFRSIYGSSTVDGTQNIEIDTDNLSLRNDSNSLYYDLIGASFTVTADSNAVLTGISGVDRIISDIPGSSQLINEQLLYNMAGDLFYAMPRTFTSGTSWEVTQYGIENTYNVERLSRGMFGISLSGGDTGMPDPVTDDSGYTTTYLNVDRITGTLWVDCSDRAVQELATSQRSRGTVSDQDGNGVYFTLVSNTSSKIVKA